MRINNAMPSPPLIGIDTVEGKDVTVRVLDRPGDAVKFVVLAVASDAEADRLVQDLTENPDQPLHTPRWGNAVHAALAPLATAPTDMAKILTPSPDPTG